MHEPPKTHNEAPSGSSKFREKRLKKIKRKEGSLEGKRSTQKTLAAVSTRGLLQHVGLGQVIAPGEKRRGGCEKA